MKTWSKSGLTLGAILALMIVTLPAASCGGGDSSWWDAWSGSKYFPDAGDISIDPDPLIVNTISHITITFDVTKYTDLVSKESVLDPAARTLTIYAYARERDGQDGTWDGTVVVAVSFPDTGLWHVVIPQEDGGQVGVDLYVELPEGAPVEDAWEGGEYYPDVANVATDPDPVAVNDFCHITLNFATTASTELISQESALNPDARTLTVTVQARERDNQAGIWDGTVTVPVTFLKSGVWHIVIPQEGAREATVDVYVQPAEDTPVDVVWAGDSYMPDAGDITTNPNPVTVNSLSHITVNFNTTANTDLISQESALDTVGRTLTITVYARERDSQAGSWDGKVVVPVTFLDRGVWHIIIPQENDREVSLDIYVYPQEDLWAGDAYLPNAGDISTDPDPVNVNDLVHITVNFNITDYTELVSQEWVLDPVSMTLTITVYARERSDRQGSWNGKVVVPVTFQVAGAWSVVVLQEGGGQTGVDLYVTP